MLDIDKVELQELFKNKKKLMDSISKGKEFFHVKRIDGKLTLFSESKRDFDLRIFGNRENYLKHMEECIIFPTPIRYFIMDYLIGETSLETFINRVIDFSNETLERNAQVNKQ